jgi:hypothetical protein
MNFADNFKKYEDCAPAGVKLPKINIDKKWYELLGLPNDCPNDLFLKKLCSKYFKDKNLHLLKNKDDYIERFKK